MMFLEKNLPEVHPRIERISSSAERNKAILKSFATLQRGIMPYSNTNTEIHKYTNSQIFESFAHSKRSVGSLLVVLPLAGWANIDRQPGSGHSDQQFQFETFPFCYQLMSQTSFELTELELIFFKTVGYFVNRARIKDLLWGTNTWLWCLPTSRLRSFPLFVWKAVGRLPKSLFWTPCQHSSVLESRSLEGVEFLKIDLAS